MHCLAGPERVEWGGGALGYGKPYPLHHCDGIERAQDPAYKSEAEAGRGGWQDETEAWSGGTRKGGVGGCAQLGFGRVLCQHPDTSRRRRKQQLGRAEDVGS